MHLRQFRQPVSLLMRIIQRSRQQFGAVRRCLRIIDQQPQRAHAFGMRIFGMKRITIKL